MTCPHGEIHPSACLDCIEEPSAPRERPRPVRLGPNLSAATFETTCPRCRGAVEVGDPIALTEDGWCHDTLACAGARDASGQT